VVFVFPSDVIISHLKVCQKAADVY